MTGNKLVELHVTNIPENACVSVMKLLRKHTKMTLTESVKWMDSMIRENTAVVTLSDEKQANDILKELELLNVKAELRTT